MGFYIRKSVRAGPFRFNLSKSGLGLSVGVKGFRIGSGPRGHYVHAGLGGFYYRSSLGNKSRRVANYNQNYTNQHQLTRQSVSMNGVEMIEVESGDVLQMKDTRAQELIDEINAKQAQLKMSTVIGLILGSLTVLSFFISPIAAIIGGIATLGGYAFGNWLDSYRRCAVVMYEFDEGLFQKYHELTTSFEELAQSNRAWHIPSGGSVRDLTTQKRNAGASHLLTRTQIELKLRLPDVVKSNIDVPAIPVGKQTLFFFPDFLLVMDKRKAGAVGYDNLSIAFEDSNFIEEETVPADAEILRHTWKFPNKNGGPDRRFNNNHQIPVCAYEALHLKSTSGLNELLQFSRRGYSFYFHRAIEDMAV